MDNHGDSKAKSIIRTGLERKGTPYVFGASPDRTDVFDCSSFIKYIFGTHGISLPRTSRQQYREGTKVQKGEWRAGDLLFFTTKSRYKKRGIEKIGHVAIYIGNGQILHTFRQGGEVTVTGLAPYWNKVCLGARRVV
jgi:cell wall-associated NlpC family hydrolase